MRAFFQGLLLLIVVLLALPFATGYLLHSGSLEYFLAVISGILLLTSILFLIRARVGQGLLMLVLSVIVFMYSKKVIRLENVDDFFYSSYHFGGTYVPSWLIVLLGTLLVMLAFRRS